MRWPLVPGLLLLCAALTAADPCAEALWLPASSPRLAELAKSWQGREAALAGEMAASDAAQRRGAARLAALVAVPAATLVETAATTGDPTVRRLVAAALQTRLDGIPPADLLLVKDATLVCQLLGQHPAEEVLGDAAVRRQVGAWLLDRAACGEAAALVASRGTAEAWAATLVEALAQVATREFRDRDAATADAMADALHAALQLLTRTQRSLAVYAGHLDLAVKDWRDLLAARGVAVVAQNEPEVLALIADLPQAAAIDALLARGATAIHPLDQAMAGADRGRRRELAVVARLLARRVSRPLWQECGAAGLEDMDAADTRTRLACLRRLAEAVGRLKDADGLLHLLAWTDDRDALVRGTALDLLVRLSDRRKDFKRDWSMADDGCFAPGETAWRLRRSLAKGEPDERVAAMQLIASLSCKELVDDVAAQLLAASDMVVDTALETLGHLEITGSGGEVVMRLAEDPRQAPARRIKALELGRKAGGGGDHGSAAFRTRLKILLDDPVEPVRRAATALCIRSGDQGARILAERLFAGKPADRLAALNALAEIDTRQLLKDQGGKGSLAQLVADRIDDADPAVAARAATLLLDKWPDHRYRTDDEDDANVKIVADFIATRREAVLRRATTADSAQAPCLALAVRVGAIAQERTLALLRTMPAAETPLVWRQLIVPASDLVVLLDAVIAFHDGTRLPEMVAETACEAVMTACSFNPHLLEEVVAGGGHDAFQGMRSHNDNVSDGVITKTLTDQRGRRVVLEGRPREGGERWDEEQMAWTLKTAPADAPDDRMVEALVDRLRRLPLQGDGAAHRDLLVSILGRQPAPLRLLDATAPHHVELWRRLARRDPATRQALVAWFNRQESPSFWQLRRLVVMKDPDLVPAVVTALVGSSEGYIDNHLLSWLASLDAAAVAPHLPRLVTHGKLGRKPEIRALLKQAGRLPVAAMFDLIDARRRVEVPAAPWGEAESGAVATALKALPADTVLAMADMLRLVRTGNPPLFDRLLAPLIAGGDTAAVWLRTGIPAEAGMLDAYRAALASPVPELWLVGAALALKEGRLDTAAFLDRVATLPPEAVGLAAAVSTRYLAQRCADQDARLAPILARTSARQLAAWVALCPPGEAVIAALTQRVRDPATAELAAAALLLRLRDDRERWMPAIRTLAVAANGRLDHLLR